MYTLFLDSADKYMAIGIIKDKQIIAHFFEKAWQKQSELLTEEIQKLLVDNEISPNEISKIIVGVGPGSYTGVRISLTIGKVFAFAKNLPLYTVSSLRILANFNKPSICVINARAKRSYVGVYDGQKTILEDQIMTNDELLDYINEHKDYVLCGDLSHVGLEGLITDPVYTVALLDDENLTPADVLGAKPVYMKD